MKAVVQRVSRAAVAVDGQIVGSIGRGLLVLAAVEKGDTAADRDWVAGKVANLRIFPDAEGKMNRSLLDLAADGDHVGGVLLVSNFTVAGSVRKGRRPSFDHALQPPEAETEFDLLVGAVGALGLPVETGRFGAHMDIDLVNDGPMTLIIDSADRGPRPRE